jgi:hypothetical protein
LLEKAKRNELIISEMKIYYIKNNFFLSFFIFLD